MNDVVISYAGEDAETAEALAALSALPADLLPGVRPLLAVPPASGVGPRAIDDLADSLAHALPVGAWAFLDISAAAPGSPVDVSTVHTAVAGQLAGRAILIPVLHAENHGPAIEHAVAGLPHSDLAIRVRPARAGWVTAYEEVLHSLSYAGRDASAVHLLIDLLHPAELSQHDAERLSRRVAHFPAASRFASVVAIFHPPPLSGPAPDTPILRRDFELWRRLAGVAAAEGVAIHFGDAGPPTAPGAVFYTGLASWSPVAVRPGDPGAAREACRSLVASDAFAGADLSPGDRVCAAYATGVPGLPAGPIADLHTAFLNHHLVLVARQMSSHTEARAHQHPPDENVRSAAPDADR